MSAGTAVAVALCVLAGIAASIQVAVMGRLGERVGVLEALAFSTLVTTTVAATILVAARRGAGGYADAARQPPWLLIGGFMGIVVLIAITVSAPRIGTLATAAMLITGQLIMGAAIDRFGLFGLDRVPLHGTRIAGLALLAAGAALALRR